MVSIQPKPKKGLVANEEIARRDNELSFNPAEAEEGFSSQTTAPLLGSYNVSIQPKPKKGLVETVLQYIAIAETVSIQPKPKKGLVGILKLS